MSKFLKEFAESLKGEIESAHSDLMPTEATRAPVDPTILEIVKTLEAEPLLVEPTRRFIVQKIREMNGAKLSTLYSQEEINALKAQLQEG